MTTLQKCLIAATLAVAVGTGVYEARQASELREQVETLRQQHAEEVQHALFERDEARRQTGVLREDYKRLNQNVGELIRLRGEVSLLREQNQELRGLADEYRKSSANSSAQPQSTVQPRELWSFAGLGSKGGVSLAKPAESISLLDVVEAIDGPILLNDCVSDMSSCKHDESCPLKPVWCDAQKMLVDHLSKANFAQFEVAAKG